MRKKILVIYYSQSGQLTEITDNLTAPLAAAGHSIEKVRVYPVTPYPFPWKGKSFFSVMPDCVLDVPTPMQPFTLQETSYDLIILGYQAWFLSPSIPFNSFIHTPQMQAVLKGTPVVTITGARNMWISAMERIKGYLKKAGANLAGNIALVDRHHNFVSFITIFQWMFKAKKERYLGIFPKPGVSDADIAGVGVFGETINRHLESGDWAGLQPGLLAQKATVVKYHLMFIESKARRIFSIWANLIVKRKKRDPWLVAFKYYLLIALFIAAPIILTVDAIFFKPFLSARIKKQKAQYSGVN